MIHVTFMGHIKASMGRERMDIDKAGMSVEELFIPNISPGLADYLRATGED